MLHSPTVAHVLSATLSGATHWSVNLNLLAIHIILNFELNSLLFTHAFMRGLSSQWRKQFTRARSALVL